MIVRSLSIIIPAYNEERTIHEVLGVVHALQLPLGIVKEVIVVNDCSKDGTSAAVERFRADHPQAGVVLVEQLVNRGKGAAIHRGMKEATGELLIIQDADVELDPNEIIKLLEPVLSGEADIVYGDRFANGLPYPGFSKKSYYANKFLTWFSNVNTGNPVRDMEVCYKLMPTHIAKGLDLKEERFGFEPEVTARLSRIKGLRWKHLPVSYTARTRAEGKTIGWKDGLRALWCSVKYR